MVEYLSEKQVMVLHRAIIADVPANTIDVVRLLLDLFANPVKTDKVLNRGRLQSALRRPAASFGGHDFYVSIAEKAAALMHSLVTNHPFVEGNKRVAAAAAELFLSINGYRLLADNEALEDLTRAVASRDMCVEEIRIWIERRVQRE